MASEIPIGPDFESGDTQHTTKPPPWGWLITVDLMLSELSSGLFVAAALSDLIAHDRYGELARVGYLLAFPLIVGDLFCLVADLGEPLRFHHMLRVCKIRSPMSTGVWIISLYSLIAFILFLIAAIQPALIVPRLIVAAIGIAPALYVGGYKGVLLSATAQSDWKESRWLGAELASSAGLLGAAGLLLTALFLPVPAAVEGIRRTVIAILFLNLAFGAPMMARLVIRQLRQMRAAHVAGYVVIATIAWIVPLVLSFIGGPAELAAAACLVLFGAFLFRRGLVMLPHRAVRSRPAETSANGWSVQGVR